MNAVSTLTLTRIPYGRHLEEVVGLFLVNAVDLIVLHRFVAVVLTENAGRIFRDISPAIFSILGGVGVDRGDGADDPCRRASCSALLDLAEYNVPHVVPVIPSNGRSWMLSGIRLSMSV